MIEKNTIWQFSVPKTIRFGRGSRESLLVELNTLGVRRPVLISDTTLLAQPIVERLLSDLKSAGLQFLVFDGCQAEPAIEVAEAATRFANECQVDGVVSIGGGSNIDVAKIVSAVVQHGGVPPDYFGFNRIPGATLPHIALPTTAGTGSEVSHSAVLTDTQAQVKVSTLSRWLRPSVAIVDPALTDSCPRRVTAHSGIDALVHAIEAYTNRPFSEMVGVDPQARAYEGSYDLTKSIASLSIQLVGRYLVRACNDGTDIEARDGMAEAAMLAGIAFSNSGVGIVHALEYPIGALTHCSHGEGNGLLLPHVMRFNKPKCERALREIGVLLTGESDRGCGDSDLAIEEVVRLQKQIGIETRLRDLGLEASQISRVANLAFQIKRLMDVNARQPSLEDLVGILTAAY